MVPPLPLPSFYTSSTEPLCAFKVHSLASSQSILSLVRERRTSLCCWDASCISSLVGLERFSLTLQTAFSGKTPKVERGDLEQVSIDPLLQYLTVTPSPPTVSGPGQGVELAVHFPSLRRVAIRGFSFTCSAFLDMLAFRRPTSTLPAGTAANTLLIAFIGDVKVTWALVSAWTPPSVMQIIKLESRRYVVVSPSRFTMGNPPLNRQSQSLGTSVTARLLRAASAGRLNTSIEVTSRMIVFPALKAFRTRADNTWAEIQIEAGSLNNQLGMGSCAFSVVFSAHATVLKLPQMRCL